MTGGHVDNFGIWYCLCHCNYNKCYCILVFPQINSVQRYLTNQNQVTHISPSTLFIPSKSSFASKRQYTQASLLEMMVCRLFGAKPSYEPTPYCWLGPRKLRWVKFESKYSNFTTKIWLGTFPLKALSILSRLQFIDIHLPTGNCLL